MPANALIAVTEFYVLEALHVAVAEKTEFGKYSAEKLLDDILEFKQRFVRKLSQALFDYTVSVVYGEMRHAYSKAYYYYPSIGSAWNRKQAYNKSQDYEPYSVLNAAVKQFDVEWVSDYGGSAWKNIAKSVLLRPKLPDQVFCDMCFSLSHNNAPYLDKTQSDIFYLYSSTKYITFLDIKFSNVQPGQLIVNYCNAVGYYLRKLIYRAMILGFVPYRPIYFGMSETCEMAQVDVTEAFILNYKPIEWGSKLFDDELELTPKGVNRNDYDDDYYDDCDDWDDEYEEEEGYYETYKKEEEKEEESYEVFIHEYNSDENRVTMP
jgi:hypothetical protein